MSRVWEARLFEGRWAVTDGVRIEFISERLSRRQAVLLARQRNEVQELVEVAWA